MFVIDVFSMHSNTTIQQSTLVNGIATAGFQLMGHSNSSAEILRMCTNTKSSDYTLLLLNFDTVSRGKIKCPPLPFIICLE